MSNKFPSLQLKEEDFLPASAEEKQSLVIMRKSVNFWADGMRRLRKNKIAIVSLFFIIMIIIFAYVLPSFWPYSYEQQIKYSENLAPFEYGRMEQELIDAGESVFPHICGTDKLERWTCVRGSCPSCGSDIRRYCRLCRRMDRQYYDAYYGYFVYDTGYSFDHYTFYGA